MSPNVNPLVALTVTAGADSLTIFLHDYETLLRTKALLGSALPATAVHEESAPLRMLFDSPEEAVDLVTIWYEGLGAATPSQDEPVVNSGEQQAPATKAEHLIELLKRPTGVSVQELVDLFGVKPKSAAARISVETRKRDLKAVLKDGRYYVDQKAA